MTEQKMATSQNGFNREWLETTLETVPECTVKELKRIFNEITGETTRSKNKPSLIKRVTAQIEQRLDELNTADTVDVEDFPDNPIEETATEAPTEEPVDSIEEDRNEEEEIPDESSDADAIDSESSESEKTQDFNEVESASLEEALTDAKEIEDCAEAEDAPEELPNETEEPDQADTTEPSDADAIDSESGETEEPQDFNEVESASFEEAPTSSEEIEDRAEAEDAPENIAPETEEPDQADTPQRNDKPKKKRERDPRLPPAGTVLSREYKGVQYETTVLEEGFLYNGEHFGSLSKVAKHIAGGTSWNGFLFFKKSLAQASSKVNEWATSLLIPPPRQ